MIYSNLHTHTTFSDGQDPPRAYIEAAIRKGFRSLGFSDHGYLWFDKSGGMSTQNMLRYSHEINSLKAAYADKITLFHGLENDYAQLHNPQAYDYTIGASHYVKANEQYYAVDWKPEVIESAIREAFAGDGLAFAQAYYHTIVGLARLRTADICAHIDLVKLFNRGTKYFDETSSAYRHMAMEALEQVVENGMLLEVSTAALAKGLSEPYPAVFLLERARELGARVLIHSDAHKVENLNYSFAEMEELLRSLGFTETWELTKQGFAPVPLSGKKGGLRTIFAGKKGK